MSILFIQIYGSVCFPESILEEFPYGLVCKVDIYSISKLKVKIIEAGNSRKKRRESQLLVWQVFKSNL